ncbi:UNVERIFIED_ORG: hypothetical protein ABIC54_001921 [Burkholderia sp. 1263]
MNHDDLPAFQNRIGIAEVHKRHASCRKRKRDLFPKRAAQPRQAPLPLQQRAGFDDVLRHEHLHFIARMCAHLHGSR